MNRIWRRPNATGKSVTVRNSASVFLALFTSILASWTMAGTNDCSWDQVNDIYYRVDPEDLAPVAVFFYQLADEVKGGRGDEAANGRRDATRTYYDLDDHSLLKSDHELYLQTYHNLPRYREDRRQIFFNDISGRNTLTRQYDVKNYKRRTSSLDKHPLIGKIRRSQRENFFSELSSLSIKSPDRLAKVLQSRHDEQVILFRAYGAPVAEVVLDTFTIKNFGIGNTHVALKINTYSEHVKDLNQQQAKEILSSLCKIRDTVRTSIQSLNPQNHLGYKVLYEIALDDFPARPYFSEYPLLYRLLQIFTLSVIGLLVLSLLMGRYTREDGYRLREKSRNLD